LLLRGAEEGEKACEGSQEGQGCEEEKEALSLQVPVRGRAAVLAVFLLLAGCTIPGKGALAPGGQQPAAGGQTSAPGSGPAVSDNGTGSGQAGTQAQPSGNQSNGTAQPGAGSGQAGAGGGTPAAAIPSQELAYDSFGWKIYGTLYPAKNAEPVKTIFLLHMLGTDRSDYPTSFIAKLHDEVPDAVILAIDLRGHGRSTNLGTWQDFGLDNYKGMKDDVTSALQVLKAKYPTMKENYVVGASMGSSTAILAAEQHQTVTKVAMISPGLNYHEVAIESAAENYAHSIFITASRGDYQSADAAAVIYGLASSPDKTLKIYEGTAHGADLFESTKNNAEPLDLLLVRFLKN
jgi:pimeloyl-ACP methyl ester carboxylesterase